MGILLVTCAAEASTLSAADYVVLEMHAEQMQDVSPRFYPARFDLPAPFRIAKTKYFANARLYFAPQLSGAPSYLSVKYNFRKANHQIVDYDTGPRIVTIYSAAESNRIQVETAAALEARVRLEGMKSDYSEPRYDENLMLAMSSNRSDEDAVKGIEDIERVLEGNRTAFKLGLRENASLAFPKDLGGKLGVQTDLELAIDYTMPDSTGGEGVYLKRRYRGKGITRSLDSVETKLLNELSLLARCESALGKKPN